MRDCGMLDVGCKVKGAVGDTIESMAEAVIEGLGKALASLGTMWVKVGTPNLTTTDGGTTPTDPVAFIQGSLWWYMAAAAVMAVIVGGAKMAWEQRAEPGRELLKGLLTLTVVSGAGLTAIALAVTAADGFSQWVLDRSLEGTSFSENIVAMVGLTTASTGVIGAFLVIALGLVAILVSLAQIMLMVVRSGMLVILAGILPLSASFTSTEMGRAWLKKCVTWLIAFILYKPAAAIVYATAFRLVGSDVFGKDKSGLLNVLVGLVLMMVALFALPALLRFVTPMVAATAGGGGGSALGGAAAAALPTGAVSLARRTTARSGGGTHESSETSTASGSTSTAASTRSAASGSKTGSGSGTGDSSDSGDVASRKRAAEASFKPASGGAASTAGGSGAAAGGGAAAAGKGAAAAAGPAAAAASGAQAAASQAKKAGAAGADAARGAAENSTREGEEEGPSGSR